MAKIKCDFNVRNKRVKKGLKFHEFLDCARPEKEDVVQEAEEQKWMDAEKIHCVVVKVNKIDVCAAGGKGFAHSGAKELKIDQATEEEVVISKSNF